MVLHARCDITFQAFAPTPLILMLRPRSGFGQWVMREEYTLNPHTPVTEYTDGFGNLCQSLLVPEGEFTVSTDSMVEARDVVDVAFDAAFVPVLNLPETALQFLLPSRYCQSDQLNPLAMEITGELTPGYAQVDAIQRWVHENIQYLAGTSNASTSALDTANGRAGVCRDMAHLGIALCRSLNIPARMVVGYLHELQPMDLHAWFEAFVGGRWFTFDPKEGRPLGNRIAIAYGRDAADVSLATQFGPMQLTSMQVSVEAAGR